VVGFDYKRALLNHAAAAVTTTLATTSVSTGFVSGDTDPDVHEDHAKRHLTKGQPPPTSTITTMARSRPVHVSGHSANDSIGLLIARRFFQRCVRPLFVAPDITLHAESYIEPMLAQKEAQDLQVAHLYASIVSSVSTAACASSMVGAILSRVLEGLEEDAHETHEAQYMHSFNGHMITSFFSRILTWAFFRPTATTVSTTSTSTNNNHLNPAIFYSHGARYMRSLLIQVERLYETCREVDENPQLYSIAYVATLRRKIGLRLQLISIMAGFTHSTLPYRNGIVKVLFSFLGMRIIYEGAGTSLFTWILDLLPLIPCSVFAEHHYEVRSLSSSILMPHYIYIYLYLSISISIDINHVSMLGSRAPARITHGAPTTCLCGLSEISRDSLSDLYFTAAMES
jgi:hypothetical protein